LCKFVKFVSKLLNRLPEKVAAGFPACRCSGFQPQVGWRTGGKMPPSLATKMVAATFSDSL
jgi:hypothetical protein